MSDVAPAASAPVSGTGFAPPATPSSFGDETLPSSSGWSAPAPSTNVGVASLHTLQPGRILGNRYEILQLLGEGGMGAVYKARDIAVDRFVAVKVIRPDLASRPDILARFKQELILARQVTHKNVIRIFDLGEAEGLKFITMDFIEGRDLKSILREKGKVEADEATKIVTQICRALDAAHSEGVVHRDLKPQNIMVDAKGRVTVMDFGIARSMEMPGMTQTGSLVGTPEYMSPEQAKGEDVDARSDLFTLGIIFYELLTGKTPFYADTAYATLLKRTQERARDPVELEPTISPQISGVVMKCLETNREQRYASALDIIHDLGQQTVTATRTTLPAIAPAALAVAPAPAKVSPLQQYRLWIAGGAIAVILASVLVVFRSSIFPGGAKKTHPTGPTASLLILPFRNASGDPSLDWMGKSLAEILGTDVGQSEALRTVPADRLHQILNDLRISPNSELDADTIRRIAEFTSADHVVSGQYAKYGNQVRIDATVQDLKAQRTTPISATAPSEQDFPHAVDDLAQSIQKNLTLPAQAREEMKAAAFAPSSKSMGALRAYSDGMDLLRQGNYLDATKKFEAATTADANFALAYTRLAQAYFNLGHDKEAEQWSTKAVDLSGSLPPAEKYMIQAFDARIANNYDTAIRTYDDLLKLMPNDSQVQFELGSVYAAHGAFDPAREHFLQALQADPKYVDALVGLGTVEFKRGNPQGSIDYLNRALSLAVELNNQEGKAGALQAIADDYKALNRPTDALQNFQQSLDIKKQLGDKKGMAVSLDMMAQIYEATGKSKEAEAAYRQAVALDQEIGDQADAGNTMVDLGGFLSDKGRYDEALTLTKQALQVELQVGNQNNQTICLSNIGNIYFLQGHYQDALPYLQQAADLGQKLNVPINLANALDNLGETYRKLGQYDQAMNNYLKALEVSRSGGYKLGIAAISDSMASVFEVQGRYGAALNAEQEAFNTIRDLGQQDATSADIQSGYGNALTLLGRGDEAQKILDGALSVARSVQNDSLVAKVLDLQGERLFYRGDTKAAQALFDQALQAATRANDRNQQLVVKFDLARVSVMQGGISAAAQTLKALAKDADATGERYVSTECSLYFGEALVQSKDYVRARQALESVVRTAQDSGMKSLLPQANYWLSMALRGSGNNAEASTHLQQARQLLQDMHTESRSDGLLQRADLRLIAEAGQK